MSFCLVAQGLTRPVQARSLARINQGTGYSQVCPSKECSPLVDKWHGAGAAACLARVEVHPCLTEACLAQWEGSVGGLSGRAQ